MESNILGLVVSLEDQLTNVDRDVRKKGIEALCEKLYTLQYRNLLSNEVESLLLFFCERLEEHYTLIRPVLQSLLYLTKCDNFSSQNATVLIQSIFTKVQTQSLQYTDRNLIHKIIAELLSRHLPALQQLSHDFVFGFIQTVDGEKDPRNLILLFQATEIVIKSFDTSRFLEDLFEVVACYFPINFSPEPNDPRGISRGELIRLNRNCLTATPDFAKFLLPQLLEKMSSDLRSAQKCALDTLAEASTTFHLSDLVTFEMSFLDCLREEIHRGSGADYHSVVLNCGKALAKRYNDKGSDADLSRFGDELFKRFGADLLASDATYARESASFIAAVLSAGPRICVVLLSTVTPFLIRHLISEENEFRATTISILSGFIDEALQFPEVKVDAVLRLEAPSLVNKLKSYLASASKLETEEKCIGLLGRILSLDGIVPVEEQVPLLDLMLQAVESSPEDSTRHKLRHESVLPLGLVCRRKNSSAHEINVLEKMKNIVEDEQCSVFLQKYCLKVIQFASNDRNVFLTTFPWLISKIRESERVLPLQTDLGETLYVIVQEHVCDAEIREIIFYELTGIVTCLIKRCDIEFSLIQAISRTLVELTASLDAKMQEAMLSSCFFTSIDDPTMNEKMLETTDYSICKAMFLCSVVFSLEKEVVMQTADELLPLLFCWIQEERANHTFCIEFIAKAYASVLNKLQLDESPQLKSQFTEHKDTIIKNLLSSEVDISGNRTASHLSWLFWCCRALLLRNEMTLSTAMLNSIIGLLDVPALSGNVAKHLPILLKRSDDALTASCHALVSPVYAQKCFYLVSSRLKELLQNNSNQQDHILTAYIQLAGSIGSELLSEFADEVLPYVMKALLMGEVVRCECRSLALNILGALATSTLELLKPYMDDLIPAVTILVQETSEPLEGRITALQLISQLAHLDSHVIARHRDSTLKALRKVSDDRKRVIRVETGKALDAWHYNT